jgi:hypothetical protein
VYLGQSVPYDDLKSIYEVHQPSILITALISSIPKASFDRYVGRLAGDFNSSTILLTGLQVYQHASAYPNVHILRQIADLNHFLKN